jgi:hypothetical protein
MNIPQQEYGWFLCFWYYNIHLLKLKRNNIKSMKLKFNYAIKRGHLELELYHIKNLYCHIFICHNKTNKLRGP